MPTANKRLYLEVSSIPLSCLAWHVVNTAVLFSEDQRGQDRLIPGANGVIAYRRRRTVIRHTLEMQIFGKWGSDDAVNSDVFAGLIENIQYLNTNVAAPVATSTGTRPAVLHLPDASTLTANVHAGPLTVGNVVAGSVAFATLDISIPAGRFA